MCKCFPIPIAKCAIYLIAGLVALTAAAVLGVAVMFFYSNSYQMIEDEQEGVAIYVFGLILGLGIVILTVALCGCLAAKKNSRCTVFSFALTSLFFMIFLFIMGVLVVEVNRYVVEVIEDENGEADVGLLGLIPGFNNVDFTITAEDREKYKNVNQFMCSEICPCAKEYEDMYQDDSKTAENYRFARFTTRSDVTVDHFYPECYERLLSNSFESQEDIEMEEQFFKLIKIIEKIFDCSGIDERIYYYVVRPVSDGPPVRTCGDLITRDSQKNILSTAIVILACAFCLLLLFVVQYCLWCRSEEEEYQEEDRVNKQKNYD